MNELTIALQGNKSLSDYRTLAQLTENLGFDGISVYADLGFQPAIVPLLEIARSTTRLRIGPAGLNPYLIHPVEIAGQIAMLDHASDGRAYLGLVRGAWLEPLGIHSTTPIADMRDAVAVIQHLLSGDTSGYTGNRFSLPPDVQLLYPVLRPEIPLLIGTWGPKMLGFASAIAAEVKIGGSTNPDLVPHIQRYLGSRSGNPVGICFGAVTVVDEDGPAARAIARREVARYLPVVAPLDPSVDCSAIELDLMATLVDQGALDEAASPRPGRHPRPLRFFRYSSPDHSTNRRPLQRRRNPDRVRHPPRHHRRWRHHAPRQAGPTSLQLKSRGLAQTAKPLARSRARGLGEGNRFGARAIWRCLSVIEARAEQTSLCDNPGNG